LKFTASDDARSLPRGEALHASALSHANLPWGSVFPMQSSCPQQECSTLPSTLQAFASEHRQGLIHA